MAKCEKEIAFDDPYDPAYAGVVACDLEAGHTEAHTCRLSLGQRKERGSFEWEEVEVNVTWSCKPCPPTK